MSKNKLLTSVPRKLVAAIQQLNTANQALISAYWEEIAGSTSGVGTDLSDAEELIAVALTVIQDIKNSRKSQALVGHK